MKTILISIIFFIIFSNIFSQNIFENKIDTSKTNITDYYGRQGKWYLYDNETKQLLNEFNYINSVYNGSFVDYYHKTGKTKLKGFFKYGLLDSIYISYYQNGKVQFETKFKDGVIDGITIFQTENGEILLRCNFINGVVDSTYKEMLIDSTFFHKYIENQNLYFTKHINYKTLFPKFDTIVTKQTNELNRNLILRNGLIYKVQFTISNILYREIYFVSESYGYNIGIENIYNIEPYSIKGVFYDIALIKEYSIRNPNILKKIYIGFDNSKKCKVIFFDKNGSIKRIKNKKPYNIIL